jgi:hypothetical protein
VYLCIRFRVAKKKIGMKKEFGLLVSLTAIYRIGNFKEKKKKAVDTSRMGY